MLAGFNYLWLTCVIIIIERERKKYGEGHRSLV